MEYQQQNGMVQWNGTGWKALFDEACSAGKALQALKTAMANMTVHGRDFEDNEGLRTAQAEHRVILSTLAQAEDYLQQRIDHTLKGHMDHLPKPMKAPHWASVDAKDWT